ncbi:MAG: DUF1836 domain-containing protein [Oscillospiraceae bacterium]|nr:DUF1836 domain-containing protein [Oscillospiraceae bacterium]
MNVKHSNENNLKKNSHIENNPIVSYDQLPMYDLFLSQVTDYLNDKFVGEGFTNNIIQNYIKNEAISRPEDKKKRGYTKKHIIQLVLLSYMRPVLTTEEIKKVFSLAFNDINNDEDDIISWEEAYKVFSAIQYDNFHTFLDKIVNYNIDSSDELLKLMNIEGEDEERIKVFLLVLFLVSEASAIKKIAQNIVDKFNN